MQGLTLAVDDADATMGRSDDVLGGSVMEYDVGTADHYGLSCPVHDSSASASAGLTADIWGRLLALPKGGTLFIDMDAAPTIDAECAFAAIGGLLNVLGRSFFAEKHVVLVRLRRRALASILQAVDQVGEAFMYIDEHDEVHVEGSGYVKTLRDAFEMVRLNESMSATDLADTLNKAGGNVSASAANGRLNELFRLGFLVRAEVPSSGSRRAYTYSVFDPIPLWKAVRAGKQQETVSRHSVSA